MNEPKNAGIGGVDDTDQARLTRGLASERDYTDGQVEVLKQRLRVLESVVDRHPADRARELDKLQELIEARLSGLDQAGKVADTEREKAAGVIRGEQEKAAAQLRSEQHRALDQANEEREKTAAQLRIGLERAIDEGDDRLREHILNQIQQIKAALESGEKLELERLARVDADVRSLAREQTLLRETSTQAQSKFENEVSERFKQVNEFRASLDDLGKTMATRREMEASSITSQERYDEHSKQLQDLRSRLDIGPQGLVDLRARVDQSGGRVAGVAEGRTESRTTLDTTTKVIGAVIGAIVLLLAVLNYTSLHRSSPTPSSAVVCTASYHPAPCPTP